MPSSSSSLPAPASHQNHVTISALHSGALTLPSHRFITPTSPSARRTVPSLSFLIQHPAPDTAADDDNPPPTRLLFDLGLRKPLSAYPSPIRKLIETRHPTSSDHDVVQSLARGRLSPDDVDWVILSHVHWDHIGTPSLFSKSTFVVGAGSIRLLQEGSDQASRGGHEHFEADLLPKDRVVQLPAAPTLDSPITTNGATHHRTSREEEEGANRSSASPQGFRWRPLAHFPRAIDFFQDGSLYIIDAPGHLPGHLNILARIGREKWIYLAGDACHDRRILTGEVAIATWEDAEGKVCCVHRDVSEAKETLERIRVVGRTDEEVEVVLAHDVDWAEAKDNEARFWPGVL